MIGLYLGCAEISDGVAADRKVSLTAAALANLTSQVDDHQHGRHDQYSRCVDRDHRALFGQPTLTMTVSCLSIDSNRNATVKWSVTRNGTAREPGRLITIPSALAVPNTQLIFSEVSYAYTPTVGYTITGTLTLSDQMYMSPRITAPTYNGTACT